MVWWGASLRYETGEKKLNEVDLISQGVEMISSFLEKFGGGFEQDIDNEGKENRRYEDGDGEVRKCQLEAIGRMVKDTEKEARL
ncbi:hypothetical protein Tco_1361545 [Tanacetum coccineum]